MTSDHHKRPRQPRSSGSERQQRYRAAHKLRSIDISQATADLLADLRTQTGLGNDGVIAAAAELLARSPKALRKLAKAQAAAASASRATKERPRAEPPPPPPARDKAAHPVGRMVPAPAAAPAAGGSRQPATRPRVRRKAQPIPDPKQPQLELG